MKSTKNSILIQRAVAQLCKQFPVISRVVQQITKAGGTAFLVGGAVRDIFLKVPVKDVDIEVHGISLEKLQSILKEFGPIRLVGKIYSVLSIDGYAIDWAVPRKDSTGRKPRVEIDPHMPLKEAFARRDLTINAMGINLDTKELIDPFNGLADVRSKTLRATDKNFFKEDPLRLFRVMQFTARFGFQPDKQLNELCKKMDVSEVSRERIEQEMNKMLLKSKQPSLGLRWLQKIGRLADIFPEIAATVGVQQEPKWHPEGDVFEHTMQALDAAAAIPLKDDKDRLTLMYAALCHDLGKVTATKKRNGKWTSYGHESDSVPLAKKLLKRITNDSELLDTVCALVRHHMTPLQLVGQKSSPAAYKRLAFKLAPYSSLEFLTNLVLADRQGRNPKKSKPLRKKIWPDLETFKKHARSAKVDKKAEEPILQGRDLLDQVKPGPQLGRLVKKAYEIQINEGIQDKAVLKKRVLKKAI